MSKRETVLAKNGVSVPKVPLESRVADCIKCGKLMCSSYVSMATSRSVPAVLRNLWKERLGQFGLKQSDDRWLCSECSTRSSQQ